MNNKMIIKFRFHIIIIMKNYGDLGGCFTSCVKSLQIHIISQQKVTKHNFPVKLVNCLGKVSLLTHILYMFLLLHANHYPAFLSGRDKL